MTEFLLDFGGAFCHQLPYKSFYLSDVPFWLCGRCSGMYLGALIAYVWLRGGVSRRLAFDRRWWGFFWITMGLLSADVLIGLWKIRGWVVPRFVTGYLFGFAATLGTWSFVSRKLEAPLEDTRMPWPLLAVDILGVALCVGMISLLTPFEWSMAALTVPVMLGMTVFYAGWNGILYLLIFRKLKIAPRRRVMALGLVGVGMWAVEIGFAYALTYWT